MRQRFTVSLILILSTSGASAQPLAAPTPAPLRAKLTDQVIRQAVREELSNGPKDQSKPEAPVLGAERYESFARKVSDATVPDCLHSEGLKRQWVPLGGVYAVPFVLVAALRGKCK
jgi:hypothetical protein